MQQHGNVLAYYRETDFMSHMYRCEFYYRDILFNHVEKFIMYGKAMAFHDSDTAQKIIDNDSPYECKTLGKAVKGFDQGIWQSQWAPRVAYVGNREKYRQNPNLADLLKQTEALILAEGSWNKVWGAGFAKDDPRIGEVHLWPGANLAGNTLMRVRKELLTGLY
jgi:ribA/ribD-fused uncharacterized protein